MVRPLLDEGLVELAVELRRGDGEIRLADDEEELGRGRQLRQQLAAALHDGGAAHHAERHVGADLRAELAQRGNGQRGVIRAVERPQDGRRVGAAAAETGLHRDALADEDLQPLPGQAGAGVERLGRLPCEIVAVLRQAAGHELGRGILVRVGRKQLAVAVDLPALAAEVDQHVVMQGNGLHDGLDVVVAVGAPVQHVERQIELCESPFGDALHYALIFLPSR